MLRVVLERTVCQPEKRKVDSSILSLTTSFGQGSSALISANADPALSYPQPSSDHDCPCVTVVGRSLSHADRTSRLRAPGSRPLWPELAALLGVWPSSQLARCAGGRAGWRLSGAVAVLLCCTAAGLCPLDADGFQERMWFTVRHCSYLDFQRARLLRRPRSSRVYPATRDWSLRPELAAPLGI